MADNEEDDKKLPPPPDAAPKEDASKPGDEPDDIDAPPENTGDLEEEIDPDEQEDLFMNRSNALSSGPGKAIAFGFVMMVVIVFILYSLFGNKPKPVNPNAVEAVGGLPEPGSMSAPIPAPPAPGGPLSDVTPEPPPPPPPAAAPIAPPTPPQPIIAPTAPVPTAPRALPNLPPLPGAPQLPAMPQAPGAPPAPPLPNAPALPGATATQPTGAPVPPPPPPPPPPPLPPLPTAPRRAGVAPPAPAVKGLSPIGANTDKQEQARIKSNMLVVNGGNEDGTTSTAEQKAADGSLNKNDPNRAFTANALAASKADKAIATRVNNLGLTIIQGKLIDAVLESAINTDLPGSIRAIVSRDVFAESGRDVMIPKGSRLIGTYNTGVNRGQVRVLVVWTRLIRPDGVDIEIGSSAIDPLGRAGVPGAVDNKYSEIFSAAILTSVLDIGLAVALDSVSNQNSTSTTNANGTTSTGSAAAPAGAAAISNIGNVSRDVVNTMLDLRPTITIDQGTKILIFVNRDLTFPGGAAGKAFVQ